VSGTGRFVSGYIARVSPVSPTIVTTSPLSVGTGGSGTGRRRGSRVAARAAQGFLSNITNPKVLMFYLAVLPQFLGPDTGTTALLIFALSHALLLLAYLLVLTSFLHRARAVLERRAVRILDSRWVRQGAD
jgi:threonine/homoserine/homoserine lactone efflux protein